MLRGQAHLRGKPGFCRWPYVGRARREYSFAFPQEDQDFANCVTGLDTPLETGEDGRATLEIIVSAYERAATGRKVALPFTPPCAPQERLGKKPLELWLR